MIRSLISYLLIGFVFTFYFSSVASKPQNPKEANPKEVRLADLQREYDEKEDFIKNDAPRFFESIKEMRANRIRAIIKSLMTSITLEGVLFLISISKVEHNFFSFLYKYHPATVLFLLATVPYQLKKMYEEFVTYKKIIQAVNNANDRKKQIEEEFNQMMQEENSSIKAPLSVDAFIKAHTT